MRRVWAALSLAAVLTAGHGARADGPRYGEEQVARLLAVAEGEKEPEADRARAIRALENTTVRTHLSRLRRLMREERSLDIRLAAACTLVALGDTKAPRDLLLATAYDGERTPSCSRSLVLLSLARLGDPAAEIHLGRALHGSAPEEEPFFYADVCRGLTLLNTPGSRRLLLEALRELPAPVRLAAIEPAAEAARSLPPPDRQAVRARLLLAAREDEDDGVATAALAALLWKNVDPAAAFALLEKDPDAKVRARAARAMNRHYLPSARLKRLESALERERDVTVRAAIEETLKGQHRQR